MAAGTWTFTNGGRTSLVDGTFDLNSDTFKMALFLSTSNIGASSTTYAGLTNEHSNANGYTTGGAAITLTLSGTTTVTVDISSDPVWTASGGSITARFAVIYEVSGNVLCYALLELCRDFSVVEVVLVKHRSDQVALSMAEFRQPERSCFQGVAPPSRSTIRGVGSGTMN